MDTCLSIFQRYFPHGHHYSNQLDELGEFYLKYRRLMSHWHEVLAGKIYTLQYEELVTDQETQTHKLLDFCELPFDEACLMFHQSHREVRTASFSQVRKPIYQDSIARWKRYESQLAPLRKVLSL
jgi:hypothetical protein